MKLHKKFYIYLLALPVLLLNGCQDDDLLPDGPPTNPNAITFSAEVLSAAMSGQTRSGGLPIYEPLELRDDRNATLYLHTYEVDKIGFRPGEDIFTTRAAQVETVESLIKFNKNFTVLARKYDNGEHFFGWEETQCNDSQHNIWFTAQTKYWPGQDKVAFHAVSPSIELNNLAGLEINDDHSMHFSYTAHKGNADKDAELQPDLLIASSVCNKEGSVAGRAPLKFNHALSAVKFAVRDVLDGEVVNIKIAGVHASGSCDFTANPTTGIGEFNWSPTDEPSATFSQNFNYKITDRGIVDVTDDSKDIIMNDTGMPEKTFMMIPQVIPDNAEIIVTLKRTGITPEQIEVRGRIKANNVLEWKPGHEYVYTISTSKDNWVNVFKVGGNHDSQDLKKNEEQWGDQIYVYSPGERYVIDAGAGVFGFYHDQYGNNAYMNVVSFRYRANQPSYVEDLPWTASHGDSEQYRVINSNESLVSGHKIKAADWILSRDALAGTGSHSENGERKNLVFEPHHQLTDWPGDLEMQDNDAYPGNSESNPWDLSTCGGHTSKNTANCYVIDRQGWYKFPTVYGNGYKNNFKNTNAYSGDSFVDYNMASITDPDIQVETNYTVGILWSDVYNAISNVSLSSDRKNIIFEAHQHNMQQGNVIIALYNGAGTIVWSWHIWITEHWLDDDNGQPNALYSGGDFASFQQSSNDWRKKGDLLIDNQHVSGSYNYYITPYNIGWCDPKNIDYLRRRSTMEFVQKTPDGSLTGKKASLPIIQEGSRVNYREGNNTYYQWGRKDPFIGFLNRTSTEKRNFMDSEFNEIENSNGVTRGETISHPMEFYYNHLGEKETMYGKWCSGSFYDLWDYNGGNQTAVVKTVYDPCPPGYMVPPVYVFRFIGTDNNDSYNNNASKEADLANFNGEVSTSDPYTFKACVNNKSEQTLSNTVWLTSTGERWDRNSTLINGVNFVPGYNFNAQLVYLWSADPVLTNTHSAYSMALGHNLYDNGREDMLSEEEKKDLEKEKPEDTYCICSYFLGRKTMARPVRAIRE